MVDFRGFSAAFNSTYRSLSEDFNDRERLKLAKNADARAAAGEGRAAQAAADARAAAAMEFGSEPALAEKAAPSGGSGGRSRAMAIPSRLGGVTDTGEPVPVGPDAETDPATNEAMETAVAEDKGFTPAPPAGLGANRRAIEGDNPAPRRSALPTGDDIPPALLEAARNGNTAAAARVRALRSEAQARAKDERDFSERARVNTANINQAEANTKLTLSNLDENNFKLTEMKLKQLNNGITAKLQDFDGVDDAAPLVDPKLGGKVKSVIDDMERFHAATPDGKSVKVNRKDNGYEIIEIDDETGKPVSEQFVTSIGELRDFGRMTGVIAQGENLGQYTAGVLGDKLAGTIAKSKSISEEAKLESQQKIGQFLDRKALADPEKRKALALEAERLAALMGDDAYDMQEKVEVDPETGRQMRIKTRENKFLKMMALATPSTTIETPKGPATADQFIQQTVLKNPQAAIQEAGGIDNLPMSVAEQMVKRGWPRETAEYYGQLAAQQVQGTVTQALQKTAMPNSVRNTVPPTGVPARGPNPRNPAQGSPRLGPNGQPVLSRAGIPLTN